MSRIFYVEISPPWIYISRICEKSWEAMHQTLNSAVAWVRSRCLASLCINRHKKLNPKTIHPHRVKYFVHTDESGKFTRETFVIANTYFTSNSPPVVQNTQIYIPSFGFCVLLYHILNFICLGCLSFCSICAKLALAVLLDNEL